MKIIISCGPHYYCYFDEEAFFGWLKKIQAVKEIGGSGEAIELTIISPIDREDFYELVGLFSRYELNCAPLRQLCEGQSDPWFRDPTNYWYRSVYESTGPKG